MDLRNRQKAGERGKKSPLEEDGTCNPSAEFSCIVDAVFSLPHFVWGSVCPLKIGI